MRAVRFSLIALSLLLSLGCQDRTRTRKVLEPFALVPGTPTVESQTPQIKTDTTTATGDFGIAVPRQCDGYTQLSVRKVDILWVIDSSGSMGPKQARLAANFDGFIQQLVNANPPIDFHIAVTTTDTDNAATRGKLRSWSLSGQSDDYIACFPQTTGTIFCNTGGTTATAVTAFGQMSQVGTTGSPQERGLYAAYLALTNTFNNSTEAVTRFVRPDAALYVVMVSDEDDSSCSPMTRQAFCTADPGCRCAPDQALGGTGAWGSTAYFVRFFETFKGYGNGESVAVAAIVSSDIDSGVPSQFGDPNPHVGCCRSLNGQPCPTSGVNDGGFEISYFANRYVQVAAATGGVTVNICQDDFSGALSSLGFSASGLRREFRLSRGPDVKATAATAAGVQVFVSSPDAANCTVDGNCPMTQSCRNGRCGRRVGVGLDAATTGNGAKYVRCDAAGLRNMVRFDGTSVPSPLSTVEICYDVLPTFSNSCP